MSQPNTLAPIPVNTEIDPGEPRIRDIDLAERLGYEQPRQIRELIERNLPELQRYGLASYRATPITSGKGRLMEVNEYWLNEGQALLICTLSRTERAADVRQLVITTYQNARRGILPPRTPAPEAPEPQPESLPPPERAKVLLAAGRPARVIAAETGLSLKQVRDLVAASRPKRGRDANRIREWRRRRGVTQIELAVAIGIDAGHLSRLERGQVPYVHEDLQAIADKLDCRVPELFGDAAAGDAATETDTAIELAIRVARQAPELSEDAVIRIVRFALTKPDPHEAAATLADYELERG